MKKEKAKWFIACYDIREPKRLRRVFKVFKDAGLQIQYSVFVINVRNAELHQIMKVLNGIIDQEADDIRFYPIRHPSQLWMYGDAKKPGAMPNATAKTKEVSVPSLLLGLSKKLSSAMPWKTS